MPSRKSRAPRTGHTIRSSSISYLRVMAAMLVPVLLIISAFLSSSLLAVTACPDPIRVRQPDGSLVTIYLWGDEYFHWNEDETGYAVMLSPDRSRWVYAREELGRLVPTDLVAGQVDPRSSGRRCP